MLNCNIYRALLSVIVVYAFASCRPDTKPANWEVEALSPIANSRIEVTDIVEDTSLSVAGDGQFSIIYRSQLADFGFDQLNEPLSAPFLNTVKLETIDLGQRVVAENITLGRLASQAGLAGQFINQNHGNNQIIPSFSGLGPEVFTIDATGLFQSLTLTDGWMYIQIDNGLPIDLTNLNYRIENTVSTNLITQNSVAAIPSGTTRIDSVQLTNGITLEGQLSAIMQNLDSPGTGGNLVLIDTTDAITITVTIKDLVPSAATAIFPTQTIVNDTATTLVDGQGGLFTSMHVREGKLFIKATSTIEDEILLQYFIPGATKNGVPFLYNENVDPAPIGGTASKDSEVDISGFSVDLTGRPDSFNVYNQFYTILLGRIDSSGNLITLSLQDSVFLNTGITDLTADRGYGYLGKDTVTSTERVSVDFFKDINAGQFDLQEVRLSVVAENYLGAPLSVQVDKITSRSQDGAGTEELVWNDLGNKLLIAPAQENVPGQMPTPGILQLELTETNSNIEEILEIKPDSLQMDLQGFLNLTSSSPDFNQFVYIDYGLKAFLELEIPLYLSADSILFIDTTAFNYLDLDPDYRMQRGSLKLIGENRFPLDFKVDMVLINDSSEVIGELYTSDIISAAQIDADGRLVSPTKSVNTYALSPQDVANLKETVNIVFRVVLNSPLDNQDSAVAGRFFNDTYLDLTLVGDLIILIGE